MSKNVYLTEEQLNRLVAKVTKEVIQENRIFDIVKNTVKKLLGKNNDPDNYEKKHSEIRGKQLELAMKLSYPNYWEKKHPEWSAEECQKARKFAMDLVNRDADRRRAEYYAKDKPIYGPAYDLYYAALHPDWDENKCKFAAERYRKYKYGEEKNKELTPKFDAYSKGYWDIVNKGGKVEKSLLFRRCDRPPMNLWQISVTAPKIDKYDQGLNFE